MTVEPSHSQATLGGFCTATSPITGGALILSYKDHVGRGVQSVGPAAYPAPSLSVYRDIPNMPKMSPKLNEASLHSFFW